MPIMLSDEYQTIETPVETEIKIKGSRFIGTLHPAATPDEAMQSLETIRQRYYDATHHCFAYQIGTGNTARFRFSDDGEPSGTAGKPILQAIQTYPLTNVILIVTRYFGGTKLGTGGLIRAYTLSATETIHQAKVITRVLSKMLFLHFDYSDSASILRLLHQRKVQIVDSDYGKHIVLSVNIRRTAIDRFIAELTELTGGRAVITEKL